MLVMDKAAQGRDKCCGDGLTVPLVRSDGWYDYVTACGEGNQAAMNQAATVGGSWPGLFFDLLGPWVGSAVGMCLTLVLSSGCGAG